MAVTDDTTKADVRKPPEIPIYKPKAEQSFVKMIVYGAPGVGKTTLAASTHAVPGMGPTLVVNIEGGVMAISDPSVYGAKDVPDTMDFKSFSDLVPLFNFLKGGKHQYRSLVIDSVSELAVFNLDAVTKAAWEKNTKADRVEDDIYLEDYGRSTKQMRKVLRLFRDLPMHVIMTCHDQYLNQEQTKVGPALTPKLRTSVVGMVDICAYMFMKDRKVKNDKGEETDEKESVRFLLTTPTIKFEAKDRTPGQKLGGIIEEPTMQKIWKLMTK